MIPIPSGVRVWIATGHTDMRRGMEGLAAPLELDGTSSRNRSCGLIMHINKVSHVKTITLVAKELGENEDWLTLPPRWSPRTA